MTLTGEVHHGADLMANKVVGRFIFLDIDDNISSININGKECGNVVYDADTRSIWTECETPMGKNFKVELFKN